VRIAVQLYTLRRLDATLPELLHVVAGSGFDGVEFAGLGDADPVDLLDGLGDRIRLVHGKDVDVGSGAPVDLGEGDVDGCVRAARRIGADWLGFEHDLPDEPVATVEAAAKRLRPLH